LGEHILRQSNEKRKKKKRELKGKRKRGEGSIALHAVQRIQAYRRQRGGVIVIKGQKSKKLLVTQGKRKFINPKAE